MNLVESIRKDLDRLNEAPLELTSSPESEILDNLMVLAKGGDVFAKDGGENIFDIPNIQISYWKNDKGNVARLVHFFDSFVVQRGNDGHPITAPLHDDIPKTVEFEENNEELTRKFNAIVGNDYGDDAMEELGFSRTDGVSMAFDETRGSDRSDLNNYLKI